MLTTPSPDALIALVQMQETPRWREVEGLIEAEIEALTLRLLGARDTADVHEFRGRVLALREFRQTVQSARSMLAKQGRSAPLA
jgi:hypothetical protein